MAKQKIEIKTVKPVVLRDHYECKYCEPLKNNHIYCNHIYIRMIMPDEKSECIYFPEL